MKIHYVTDYPYTACGQVYGHTAHGVSYGRPGLKTHSSPLEVTCKACLRNEKVRKEIASAKEERRRGTEFCERAGIRGDMPAYKLTKEHVCAWMNEWNRVNWMDNMDVSVRTAYLLKQSASSMEDLIDNTWGELLGKLKHASSGLPHDGPLRNARTMRDIETALEGLGLKLKED